MTKTPLKSFLISAAAVLVILFPSNRETLVYSQENTPAVSTAFFSFSILDKINSPSELLKTIPLKVGSKSLAYEENRWSRQGDKIFLIKKKFKEPEKEIALELLHLDTWETEVIKIVKRGGDLIAPSGYHIEVVERPSGIRWNKWNTEFQVMAPAKTIVLRNKFPQEDVRNVPVRVKSKSGQWKTVYQKKTSIEEIVYSPYSQGLHTPEMIESGRNHVLVMVEEAIDTLRSKKVESEAFPGKLVADNESLSAAFYSHLPFLEQSDFGEFLFDSQKTVERVAILLAANQERAFGKTCSKANACGWIQFTPKTYKAIRKAYPAAGLWSDFEQGAANHLNSMMAAILLYDHNLRGLVQRHGEKILKDPRLEEYLAASYNGSPLRATKSLKAALSKGLDDWTGKLRTETKEFIVKLKYLQENNFP